MNHLILVVCLAVVTVNIVQGTTDFCSTAINCNGRPHIGCGNSGNFASTCPAGAALVTLSSALKDAIVNAHNEKRNFVAGGGDPNHDAACRMGTMQWDDELAYLASLNVKQCEMKHDQCRNTDQFKWAGQNLAYIGYYDPIMEQQKFEQSVTMWYNEIKDSNRNYIDAYPSNYNGPTIGHFTGMIGDVNNRVGCAASYYQPSDVSYKVFLVACNYATTNVVGKRIYASCPTAASGCTTGTNPAYSNLCSTSESYAVNGWW